MARKINTSRTGNSGVVKDGIYELIVLDAEESTFKSGNEGIVLHLSLVRESGPYGREIRDYLTFDPEDAEDADKKNQWKFDQLHDALEVPEGIEITAKYYKNKRVFASLVTDEYQGNVNNRVRTYLAPDIAREMMASQAAKKTDDFDEELPEPTSTAKTKANISGKGKRVQPQEMEEEDIPL